MARAAALALAVAAAVLAGCASGPQGGKPGGKDGPEANPPTGLDRVPDAVPRIEPLRSGGPNKPYRVLGRSYTPMTEDLPLQESGLASWYGRKFHGQPTSNGEIYDMYAMTAAHKTMPLPSYARVRNPANGREIIVRVNDRGPFADGRVIDLSYTAALKLGVLRGVAPVEVQRLTFDDIRQGRWRAGSHAAGNDTARDAAERLRRQTELDALVQELSEP
jgi:rare lipoprotein A